MRKFEFKTLRFDNKKVWKEQILLGNEKQKVIPFEKIDSLEYGKKLYWILIVSGAIIFFLNSLVNELSSTILGIVSFLLVLIGALYRPEAVTIRSATTIISEHGKGSREFFEAIKAQYGGENKKIAMKKVVSKDVQSEKISSEDKHELTSEEKEKIKKSLILVLYVVFAIVLVLYIKSKVSP